MASPPPNAFSNELAQWVRDKCMQSIVFVELRPKDASKVKELWDKVSPILGELGGTGPKNMARLERCGCEQCCTGFVVKDEGGDLRILTCAHVLGPAFSHEFPISAAQVNDLYHPMILCDHQEQRFQREVVENEDLERVYMRARVTQISGSMDLMVLRVSAAEVKNCCPHHPALRMARSFPKRLVSVVMLSWPIDGDRTAVEGKISHPSRPFSSLSDKNCRGYRMRLSQVDITSENGSSGAPLLDGVGNFVGVLHGGNATFSFYVSFEGLKRMLMKWSVI